MNSNKLNSSISFKLFKKFQRKFLKFKNNLAQFSKVKDYLLFFSVINSSIPVLNTFLPIWVYGFL